MHRTTMDIETERNIYTLTLDLETFFVSFLVEPALEKKDKIHAFFM